MYQKLRVFSYKNPTQLQEEYKRRFNGISSIKLKLFIKPFSKQKEIKLNETYELFLVTIPEHLNQFQQVFVNSQRIQRLINMIPDIAQKKLIFDKLIDEIQSTNDIEGVRSTKKEINSALQKINDKSQRFYGIVNMYHSIINEEIQRIEAPQDIRNIYDTLVSDEVEEKPDGVLFRKEVTNVYKGDKKIHEGLKNEIDIINNIYDLIHFMKSDLNFLYKSIITHYFFEYIHPFYDGNGRTGRFLLSSYIAKKTDVLTGLSISKAVYENKVKYGEAFAEVSNPRNFGDVTHFITDMLDIIIYGQNKTIANLEEFVSMMNSIRDNLLSLSLTQYETLILFVLIQQHLFSINEEYITDNDFIIFDDTLTRYKLKKIMDMLTEKGLVHRIRKNPSTHVITNKVIDLLD